MNAIIGKITPLMIDKLDYGIFYFYAAMGLTTFLCVLLFLPETQGKSLEEIDEVKRGNIMKNSIPYITLVI
jgi:hypothetical protein